MESTVAMCDFQMLWIAEVSGAMRNTAEVILKPERFSSEVSGAKGVGRGHFVYQDVVWASGAIEVLRREKSPTRVCPIV